MKIAVRGGHNFAVPGAKGLIEETAEDRKVKDALIKYLSKAGHNVLDVTAPDSCSTINSDLEYGVNKATNWGAELFLSIHFDKAYDSYQGKLGTAAWIYGTGGQAEIYGQRMVDAVASLGFKNRGVRVNSKLYELRKTTCPAVIYETCFTEASEDVATYHSVGADEIGRKLAEAVCNTSIGGDGGTVTPPVEPTPPPTSSDLVANAQVRGDFFYVRDADGNKVDGRRVDDGDWIEVRDISYSSQLLFVKYPTPNGTRTGYIKNVPSLIHYKYAGQWKNGSTPEPAYQTSACTNKIGALSPYESATPLFRENGILHIAYSTGKGTHTKSGFVRYNDGFNGF